VSMAALPMNLNARILKQKVKREKKNKDFKTSEPFFVQSWFIVAFILSREDHSKSHPLVSNANKQNKKKFFVFGVLVVMEDY